VVVNAQSAKVGVSLQKNNQTLRTTLFNYTDNAQPAVNCFVTVVMFDKNQTKLSIELAKGITEKSSIEDVIAAYGNAGETSDSTSFEYYTYGKIWEKVTILINKDDKTISKIEVQYQPKKLN